MTDFLSPEVRVTEKRQGPVVPTALVSPGVGAMLIQAERGPIGKPIEVTGPDDCQEVFGSYMPDNFDMDSVDKFFANGGERLFVTRIAHYSDISDRETLTAVKAATMFQSAASGAVAAELESGENAFPAVLQAGTQFDGSVDGVDIVGFTIQATPGMRTGSGATFAAGAGGDNIVLNINGEPGNQTISLATAGANIGSYIALINAGLSGAYAEDAAGQIRIVTDRKGSNAGGNIVSLGGTAAAKTGLTAGAFANAGPNNVGDDRAVSAAEFASLFETGFPGASASVDGNQVTVASDTVGPSSSLQFSAPADIATLIAGFDLLEAEGDAAGSGVDTLLVEASTEGAWGNLERVTIQRVDSIVARTRAIVAGASNSLPVSTTARIAVGDTLSITKNDDVQRTVVTNIDATNNVVQVSPAITVPSGGYNTADEIVLETMRVQAIDKDGVVQQTFNNLRMSPLAGKKYIETIINNTPRTPIAVTVQAADVTGDNRPAAVTTALLGQTTPGSDGGAVTDVDYIGNAAEQTGLHAFDDIEDALLIAIPGNTNVAVQLALESYVELRKDMFAIQQNPQGMLPTDMREYVQTTGNFASSYEAFYYPWLRAVDPRTGAGVSMPNVGFVMGMYARTFKVRNFGKAPAGVVDGKLLGAVGVDTEVKKRSYDSLYPAGVNAIQAKKGRGICVMGARTMDASGDVLQINLRMVMLVVKKVFMDNTDFVLFEGNTKETRNQVSRFMTSYLRQLRLDRVLDGEADKDAFFVICDESNNTASVRKAGKIRCRVGLNVPDTIEFAEFTLERDTRAIDAEIASDATTAV